MPKKVSPTFPASWAPFAGHAPGQLMMIQYVTYEGISDGNWLYLGADLAALGAFAKRHAPSVERHTPSAFAEQEGWRDLVARYEARSGRRFARPDDLDEDEEIEWFDGESAFAILQDEPDELVARLLSTQIVRDFEGMFAQLVTLSPDHFPGLAAEGREAYFAPVLGGKQKLFEVCICTGYYGARSLFFRAKSRNQLLFDIFHKEPLRAVRAEILDHLAEPYCRVSGEMPDDPAARELCLMGLTAKALGEALSYCYSKGDSPRSVSVVEAAVPFVL